MKDRAARDSKTDITTSEAGVVPRLISLGWPIVIARASHSVVGFADALMVAPLGREALAATTTGALNVLVFLLPFVGISHTLQSFVAQLQARGPAAPERSEQRGALLSLLSCGGGVALLAGCIAALLLPAVPTWVGWLRYEAPVSEAMVVYVSIRLVGVLPAVATEAIGNWYVGLQKPKIAMLVGAVSLGCNLVLNYLLIMPRWGLPGFGVSGAAWASVLSPCVGLVVALGILHRQWGGAGRRSVWSWSRFLQVLRVGTPHGLNLCLDFAGFVLFTNWIVGHLGTATLAAFNVVLQLNGLAFMPVFGLSTAGAILVAEAFGARQQHRVGGLLQATLGVALGWTTVVGVICVLFARELLAWFDASSSGTLVEVGMVLLVASAAVQLLQAASVTVGEVLRAAGDTLWCLLAKVGFVWGFLLPIGWLVVVRWGGGRRGVMAVLGAHFLLLTLALGARYLSRGWQRVNILERVT